jgi:hypothetical protein
MLIEYGPRNSIYALFGTGLVEGLPFGVQFSRFTPLQVDLTAIGTGTWASAGSPEGAIQCVSLLSDTRAKAEAAFFLVDGGIRCISGVAKRRPDRSLVIDLSSAGMADDSGSLVVRLDTQSERKSGNKNRIVSMDGNITIDGQPVRLKFESADPDLAAQAAMIDASLAGLKKVEGKWTQGDATTTYSGYVDDAWVRRIDATLNQGEYGSSLRRMYFTRDQLSYYVEFGEERDTSAPGRDKLNKVALRLSFDGQGRVVEAHKTVNDASPKVLASDIAGAKAYSEALRKVVEENISQSLPAIEDRLP